MEKRLYRVKVVLYVMAENESDACVAATQARFDIFECAAKRADIVDPLWKDAIPYNADDDRTCWTIMKLHEQRKGSEPAMQESTHTARWTSRKSEQSISPSNKTNRLNLPYTH